MNMRIFINICMVTVTHQGLFAGYMGQQPMGYPMPAQQRAPAMQPQSYGPSPYAAPKQMGRFPRQQRYGQGAPAMQNYGQQQHYGQPQQRPMKPMGSPYGSPMGGQPHMGGYGSPQKPPAFGGMPGSMPPQMGSAGQTGNSMQSAFAACNKVCPSPKGQQVVGISMATLQDPRKLQKFYRDQLMQCVTRCKRQNKPVQQKQFQNYLSKH